MPTVNLPTITAAMRALSCCLSERQVAGTVVRLAVSSKYPNAVDQLTTRSKRPVHGIWRMPPATYSTLTPAAAAPARARSRKTAEESRPVTRQPRAARRLASSPCWPPTWATGPTTRAPPVRPCCAARWPAFRRRPGHRAGWGCAPTPGTSPARWPCCAVPAVIAAIDPWSACCGWRISRVIAPGSRGFGARGYDSR